MPAPAAPRVALVHDFLLDLRGAERVFLVLCDLFPEADVFTAVYDEEGTEGRFAHRTVNTSFLQRMRPTARTFRALLPLYPYAMEALELDAYDLVVSSSSAWAHGVIAGDHAVHVCYCHNPFRYAWNAREQALAGRAAVSRAALSVIFRRWREWDWIAAQRVDRYVANSETTKTRISRYFGREAAIVHPPVDTGRFTPATPGEEHLVLAELMPHKRIDLAVRAFSRMGRPLTVVGDGPDARRLRRMAGPTVRFTGRIGDREVAALLARCRALVVTATEEFGIAAVEAQAAGRPVIALREGGVRETVLEGVTGTFFDVPDAAALEDAVRRFDADAIDPQACVRNAERFGVRRFAEAMREVVAAARPGSAAHEEGRAHARPRSAQRPRGARD
jgi:glycosyltransferase involved in cell wall biosynthesis